MRMLEEERGRGRGDYPIRPVWNSLLAGIVYQHESVESLRRELLRNGQLRDLCGFDPVKRAEDAVPGPHNYTRFLENLLAHQREIDRMFDDLVRELERALPRLGRHLAMDSTDIRTHARPRGREVSEKLREAGPDRRRDVDADVGVKTYRGKREGGTLWTRTVRWFGYKLHLVVDANYELPVAYEVTRASRPDNRPAARPVDDLEESCSKVLENCEALMADKAYDSTDFIRQLWQGGADDPRRVLPVIPKRQDWKEGDQTRPLLEGVDNITYDCQGQLYCHCWKRGKRRQMSYAGYEKSRDCQKWRCPAARYGRRCRSYRRCSGQSTYGRIVRVKRERDPRTFLPVARPSLKFERPYRKRTAVERVNSRLDVSFGFERHFIRGLAKMRLRCSLALVVMLAITLGRIREKQKEKMRSLVRAA